MSWRWRIRGVWCVGCGVGQRVFACIRSIGKRRDVSGGHRSRCIVVLCVIVEVMAIVVFMMILITISTMNPLSRILLTTHV